MKTYTVLVSFDNACELCSQEYLVLYPGTRHQLILSLLLRCAGGDRDQVFTHGIHIPECADLRHLNRCLGRYYAYLLNKNTFLLCRRDGSPVGSVSVEHATSANRQLL